MKKLLLIFAFLFSANIMMAQFELDEFTALEGYQEASFVASMELISPKLIFVGTQNFDMEASGKVEYNMSNGKSKFWIYAFQEEDEPEKVIAIYSIKYFVIISEVVDPEDFDISEVPINLNYSFNEEELMDSDTANVKLLECQSYKAFVESGAKPDEFKIGMFFNPGYQSYPLNIPVWSAEVIYNNEEISSTVDLNTNALYCDVLSSVENKMKNIQEIEIKVVGNNLQIFSDSNSEITLDVYSIDGTQLYNSSFENNSAVTDIYIPFDSFSSGTYVVVAKSKNGFGLQKVNVIK